jgi:Flp pilus assembly protein TadB
MTTMPAVFLVLLYFMDADSMTLLFTDSVGIGILTVVFLINVFCHLWIRRILAVDI